MYDVDTLLYIHEQEENARKAEEKAKTDRITAIKVLWETGMIPVEEYYHLDPDSRRHDWRNIGSSMKKSLENRNHLWETSFYFRDIILKGFFDAGMSYLESPRART
jgi:hypothetical protein